MNNLKELPNQSITLLGTFEDKIFDLSFEAEDDSGTMYEVLIDLAEIADFLEIEDKKINLIDGSDDVMEAARQIFDRWKTGTASYSVEVKLKK